MRYNNVEFAQNQTVKRNKDSLLRNTAFEYRFSNISSSMIEHEAVRIPKISHALKS